MTEGHISVLQDEVLEFLDIKKDGVYVDVTFGAGGHSRALLENLGEQGRLYAFDTDKYVEQYLPKDDARFCFIHQNFCYLQRYLRLYDIFEVDGILADLGISSMQLDARDRGFSARYEEAELDMRMNIYQDMRAVDWLKSVKPEQLTEVLFKYGDISNARKVTRLLIEARERHEDLLTVGDLKRVLSGCVQGNPNRYYARIFQALRMVVNAELEVLEDLLIQATAMLKLGGRLVVISFHSGEDRVVKHFFKNNPELNVLSKKPICPSEAEILANKRSRSAKLRVAEKIKS